MQIGRIACKKKYFLFIAIYRAFFLICIGYIAFYHYFFLITNQILFMKNAQKRSKITKSVSCSSFKDIPPRKQLHELPPKRHIFIKSRIPSTKISVKHINQNFESLSNEKTKSSPPIQLILPSECISFELFPSSIYDLKGISSSITLENIKKRIEESKNKEHAEFISEDVNQRA